MKGKQQVATPQLQNSKNSKGKKRIEEDDDDDDESVAGSVNCMEIRKRKSNKKREEFSGEQWRYEQMSRAEKLEKQLRTRWEVEEMIEEQLNQFEAQFKQATTSTKLKDLSQILMPKSAAPQELAALSWLGYWRPSTILGLLNSLIHSSPSFSISNSEHAKTVISQLISELRIEEAVIDEEITEIQSNCIFHLPFGLNKKAKNDLDCVYSEFRKIHAVIAKAQKLRLKSIHLAVKKVMSQTDAAEFLVAFAKIQDLIHQHALNHKLTNAHVSIPIN